MRDTIGCIMLSQGVDISNRSPTKFTAASRCAAAAGRFRAGQAGQGQLLQEDLINEQAWAAIAWSGDIFQINAEEGDKWEFALPTTGGTLWSRQPAPIPITANNAKPAPRH